MWPDAKVTHCGERLGNSVFQNYFANSFFICNFAIRKVSADLLVKQQYKTMLPGRCLAVSDKGK